MPNDADAFADALALAVIHALADACPFCNAHAHPGPVPYEHRQPLARAHLDAHTDPHADDDPSADTAY